MSLRVRAAAVGLAFALAACPKAVPVAERPVAPVAKAQTEAEVLAGQVERVRLEIESVLAAQDEALWASWTRGTPLELDSALKGHEPLWSDETLALLRRARAERADEPAAIDRLEAWLLGVRLARAAVDENRAVAALEAGLVFTLDGKPVRFQELWRQLANEPSAVRRKALWNGALEVAPQLDVALAAREQKLAASLAEAGSSRVEFARLVHGVAFADAAKLADQVLNETDAEWKATLARLADEELKLPLSKVSWADLPRALKAPAVGIPTATKAELPVRAQELLGALGLYGAPGLTVDLTDSSKKNPLPLTVAPQGPLDVRLSFKPRGGFQDLVSLFTELGHAVQWRQATGARLEQSRLATPGWLEAAGLLFRSTAESAEWLSARGVAEDKAKALEAAARAQDLYALRLAAAKLAASATRGNATETEARDAWKRWVARAIALPVGDAETARWRVDGDFFFEGVSTVRAAALAKEWRAQLEPRWWQQAASLGVLQKLWVLGEPLNAAAAPSKRLWGDKPVQGDGGWVIAAAWPKARQLAGDGPQTAGLPATPTSGTDGGEVARDGGWSPAPWPKPKTLAEEGDAGRDGGDVADGGGWTPAPWPKLKTLAGDGEAVRHGGDAGVLSVKPQTSTDGGVPSLARPDAGTISARKSADAG